MRPFQVNSRPFRIGLRRVILPEFAKPVLDYWNPHFRHIACFRGNFAVLDPEKPFYVRGGDCPESAQMQYLSSYHMQTMSMIPLRLLALQGIHTTLSLDEVEGCLTSFDEVTKLLMQEDGSYSNVKRASNFLKIPGYEPVGTLVIPYCHSGMIGAMKESDTIEPASQITGLPNVTLRTNDTKKKYIRTATKAYNQCHCDPVPTRMPFVPAASASPQMEEINLKCMASSVLARFGLARDGAAADYCSELLGIFKDGGNAPIYLIEGEKKALALKAAVDCQYEGALFRTLRDYSMTGEKNYPLAEKCAGKIIPAEVVGVSGVWQTLSQSDMLHPDLSALVNVKGRDVCICYDRDIKENQHIVHAAGVLNIALRKVGARSVYIASPKMPDILSDAREEDCKGFDDTVAEVAKRVDAKIGYLKMLEAYGISLRLLRESFIPMKTDYSRLDLTEAFYGKDLEKRVGGPAMFSLIAEDVALDRSLSVIPR